jgi:Tfp pilus assembly protein PilN
MIKKRVGLEITSENIRVVELERFPQAIRLNVIASCSTPQGAVKNGEIVDTGKTADAIKKLFSMYKINTKNVAISFSGKGVMAQQMTLPDMPVADMKEAVKSELEKYSVFSGSKIIFYYKPIARFDEKGYKKVRVFFAGISLKLLHSYIDCLDKAGLSISFIDIAPISMANAEYSSLKEEKTTALAIIKDDKAYMVIARAGKFHIFYNIDINTQGFSGPAVSADAVPGKALSSFAVSLERSFKFYQKELNAGPVERIILSYDDEKFPEMHKKLEAVLEGGIKVEPAQPLKYIQKPRHKDMQAILNRGVSGFSACIGASLSGLGIIRHDISLNSLQQQMPRPKEIRKKYILAFIACAVIAVVLAVSGISLKVISDNMSRKLIVGQEQLASLDARLSSLRELSERQRDLRERLILQSKYIQNLNLVSWSKMLDKVTSRMPDYLWLRRFRTAESGNMSIDGTTVTVDKIADFIRQLSQDEAFSNVDVESIDKKDVAKNVPGVDFQITSGLKKPEEPGDDSVKIKK